MNEKKFKHQHLIAHRLKIARTKQYKSCREFSSKHGINERTYQRHESGKTKINFETILIYARLLDIPLIYLYSED